MNIDEKYLALQEFLRDRIFKNQEEKEKTLMAFETLPEEQKEELLEHAKMRLKGERACKNVIKKYEKKLNEFKYFYDTEYYNDDELDSTDIDGNPIVHYPFTYQGNSIKLQDSVIKVHYDYEDNKVEAVVDFAPANPDDEEDYGTGVEHSSMEDVIKLLKFIHKHPTKPLKYCIDAVFS